MFTQSQIKELLSNSNVVKCSTTSITYNKKFKLWAVKQYHEEGYSPNDIFRKAGFDVSVLDKNRIKSCLQRWKKIYNRKGDKGLKKENRGRPRGGSKTNFENKEEEIEYLKTKIAYIEAENDFLAKLRGLKRK